MPNHTLTSEQIGKIYFGITDMREMLRKLSQYDEQQTNWSTIQSAQLESMDKRLQQLELAVFNIYEAIK